MTVATSLATWFFVQGANDCYWRVESPAKCVGAKLCRIDEATGGRDLLTPNEDGDFRWRETEEGSEYPELEGAAVFTRPCQIRTIHALSMKETHGARISAELDDNYLTDAKFNLHIRETYRAEPYTPVEHMKALLGFDAVIFSTDWLRDNYYKKYREMMRARPKHLPEFHVCGNHVDPDDWPERSPMRDDGRLRVGWMGSMSHLWDLKLAYPALLAASRLGHEIVIIGHDPGWRPTDNVPGINPQHRFEYTHIPWVDPREYGRPEVLKHGETAWLGQSREELEQAVLRLIADTELRERLAANMTQYIREERLMEHHKHEWEAAILG